MKKTGQCPKCGGHDVIRAQAVDRDRSSSQDATVATYDNPDALIFRGRRESAITAYVCMGCGYLEYYADSPYSLRQPQSHG
jgi:predicted nucleic-acid-binding Zn-ribbon protein